jgi:hypothetical protein
MSEEHMLMKLTAHKAILLINHMNFLGVDFVKLPSGQLITRMDCEDCLEQK